MRKRSWAVLVVAAVVGLAAVGVLVVPRGPPEFLWTDGEVIAEEPGGAPIVGWKRDWTDTPRTARTEQRPHGVVWRDHPSKVGGLPSYETLFGLIPTRVTLVDDLWRAWPFSFPSRADCALQYAPVEDEMTFVDGSDTVWTRCALLPESNR
jgi:hypothetical protein